MNPFPPKQIALFGTSADPPTIGHAAILAYLTQQFDHVAVWAAENPFKLQQTPLAQRHQMLQLLIDAPPLSAGQWRSGGDQRLRI